MVQSVTRTRTERALDLVSTPNPHVLVEDNYTVWRRSLEITLRIANLAWTLTENLVVPDVFPPTGKDQLVAAVLNHIDKSISQPVQHKLNYTAKTSPKVVLDQIDEILAEKTAVRNDQLKAEARHRICNNDVKGLDQYINGHMKVRRKMIQAEVPLFTGTDESETVRLMLLGLINHSTYGTVAKQMFANDLPSTIAKAREHLENHTVMMALKTGESRYRGMPAPSSNGRLPDDLYQSITKILDRRLNKLEVAPSHNHSDNKRHTRRGQGRAKRGKGKGSDKEGSPKSECKFNIDSGACPSILNFIPNNATPFLNPDPILTANGRIYPTHTSTIQLTTTEGKALNLPCVVCPNTDENLLSVLDCTRQHYAIIFDKRNAYLIPHSHTSKVTKHHVPIAFVKDNAYILRLRTSTGQIQGVSKHCKTAIATTTKTSSQKPPLRRIVLKLHNPHTQEDQRIVVPPTQAWQTKET